MAKIKLINNFKTMMNVLWCDFLFNADLSNNRSVNIAVRKMTSIEDAIEFSRQGIN